jgi:hypothetical protein
MADSLYSLRFFLFVAAKCNTIQRQIKRNGESICHGRNPPSQQYIVLANKEVDNLNN